MPSVETKVCILICTCDRPAFLDRLLDELTIQARDVPLVVVDNGRSPSDDVTARFGTRLRLVHDRLTSRGLVAARNRAIALALDRRPEFLVFIDDDEVPQPGWLAALTGCLDATGADIATGPVIPEFLEPPPSWAVKGGFFFREPGFGAGNLALRRSCLPADPKDWFNPAFNFLGAEDEEFLKRLLAKGARLAKAHDAVVREFVPASRLRRRFVWRTGLRDGVQAAQMNRLLNRPGPQRVLRTLTGCVAKLGYGCNHLFWSAASPWRIHYALRDFAAAAGLLLGAAGVRFSFYGRPDGRQAADDSQVPGPSRVPPRRSAAR